MKVLRQRATMVKVFGSATVNGAVVAEAEIMCVLTDRA